jgi:hypothetical protein
LFNPIKQYGKELSGNNRFILDPSVLRKLRELVSQKCEVIICASRKKGGLIKGIETMFGRGITQYIVCDGNNRDNEKIIKFKHLFNKAIIFK